MTPRPHIFARGGAWFGAAPFKELAFESYDAARYWLLHQSEG